MNNFNVPVEPHREKSLFVTDAELNRVKDDGVILLDLCKNGAGRYKNFAAAAHCYMTKEKPLAFFVDNEGKFFINPKITRALKTTEMYRESCGMFPMESFSLAERSRKIEVEYQTIRLNGELSEVIAEGLKGPKAIVFQHMVDHMEGKTIWPA